MVVDDIGYQTHWIWLPILPSNRRYLVNTKLPSMVGQSRPLLNMLGNMVEIVTTIWLECRSSSLPLNIVFRYCGVSCWYSKLTVESNFYLFRQAPYWLPLQKLSSRDTVFLPSSILWVVGELSDIFSDLQRTIGIHLTMRYPSFAVRSWRRADIFRLTLRWIG